MSVSKYKHRAEVTKYKIVENNKIIKAKSRKDADDIYTKEQEWEKFYTELLTEDRQEFQQENNNNTEQQNEINVQEIKSIVKQLITRPDGTIPEIIKYINYSV